MNQDRVINATSSKVNDCMTRMFPELIPEAVRIIQNEQTLIAQFPNRAAELTEISDAKLATLVPTLLCNEIQSRINQAQVQVARLVRDWAKDKSFGACLDSKGQIDKARLKKLYLAKGEQAFRQVVADYNEICVPYSNQLLAEHRGVWTDSETAQVKDLQNLQRKHNSLVMSARVWLKEKDVA